MFFKNNRKPLFGEGGIRSSATEPKQSSTHAQAHKKWNFPNKLQHHGERTEDSPNTCQRTHIGPLERGEERDQFFKQRRFSGQVARSMVNTCVCSRDRLHVTNPRIPHVEYMLYMYIVCVQILYKTRLKLFKKFLFLNRKQAFSKIIITMVFADVMYFVIKIYRCLQGLIQLY